MLATNLFLALAAIVITVYAILVEGIKENICV